MNIRNPLLILPLLFVLGCGGSSLGARRPVELGSAENYVMLAKTGISNVTGSAITGHLGVSPAAASYITGFSLTADASNVFSTSSSVTGKIYAADYAVPTPSNLTTAIADMETSYTDIAGRTPPDYTEYATGNLGGQTLLPGVYTWTSTLNIATDMTFSGSATDVWILQTSGDVTMAAAKNIILAGGALAENIIWQVAGRVTIGSTSHFEGIILSKTSITFGNLASLHGRAYSQTMIALDNNTITQP